jgi:hypothetical protein
VVEKSNLYKYSEMKDYFSYFTDEDLRIHKLRLKASTKLEFNDYFSFQNLKAVGNDILLIGEGFEETSRSTANNDYFNGYQYNLSFFAKFDKNAELIFFGIDHALKDGTLREVISPFHLNELLMICQDRDIKEIVTLQLEGGHQDHDIVSMLAEELAFRLSLDLFTYPAYRALHKRYPLYAVMSSPNKSTEKKNLPILLRLHFTKQSFILMKNYGSQLSTWIGLGPFIIAKYLFGNPSFNLRASTPRTIQEVPSLLLYVNRKKVQPLNYEIFRKEISNW